MSGGHADVSPLVELLVGVTAMQLVNRSTKHRPVEDELKRKRSSCSSPLFPHRPPARLHYFFFFSKLDYSRFTGARNVHGGRGVQL